MSEVHTRYEPAAGGRIRVLISQERGPCTATSVGIAASTDSRSGVSEGWSTVPSHRSLRSSPWADRSRSMFGDALPSGQHTWTEAPSPSASWYQVRYRISPAFGSHWSDVGGPNVPTSVVTSMAGT